MNNLVAEQRRALRWGGNRVSQFGMHLGSSTLVAVSVSIAAAPYGVIRAQEQPPDVSRVLIATGLSNANAVRIADRLVNVFGPRLTNSPIARAAAQDVIAQLRSWGIKQAYLEAWGLFGQGWSNERTTMRVLDPKPFPVIAYPIAWTPGTGKAVRAEVVLLPDLADSTIARFRSRLSGRIVFTSVHKPLTSTSLAVPRRFSEAELLELAATRPEDATDLTADAMAYTAELEKNRKAAELLATAGAVARVRFSEFPGGTVRTDRAGSWRKEAPYPLPELTIAAEHYHRILSNVRERRVVLELDVRNHFYADQLVAENIIAELPGADPSLQGEVVMLGAHFDSWEGGTGAMDNAAGCAIVLEALRLLHVSRIPLKRTVRLALWTGEEQYLLGSDSYVRKHFADRRVGTKTPAHDSISVYFNVDNGAGAIRGIYLEENDSVAPVFGAWMRPFADWGMRTLTRQRGFGTDHEVFDAVGIPAFQFIQDPLDYDYFGHTNMDTYERLPAQDLQRNAIILATFVAQAANHDRRLPRKTLAK